MPLTIPIAHDFICPWCWAGLFQARRLQREHGVRIEWRGYELFPKDLFWPDYPPTPERPANRPDTPTRLDFLLAADGIHLPNIERPRKHRTYNAHQAVEHAKTLGVEDELIERIYRAYWERGEAINEIPVLLKLAAGLVEDLTALKTAIERRAYDAQVVKFDDDAYARGVYNVPTFFIGGKRLAEQPYSVLSAAVVEAQREWGGVDAYLGLEFPAPHRDRPWVAINMVTTVDGKIRLGAPREGVDGLSGPADRRLYKRIESAADAVIVGAGTLRADGRRWHPAPARRVVVTRSGEIPHDVPFFTEGEGYVATSGSSPVRAPHGARLIRAGGNEVDLRLVLERLRGFGVRSVLSTGGPELNGALLRAGLVDELFVTIEPLVKLGDDVPGYFAGPALPRACVQEFDLTEHHAVGSEIFLRYRKKPEERG